MVDILAMGAHPDDVEMCCGGLLALSAQQGKSIAIVDLTQGEMGTRGTPDERAAEAAAAAKVLGVETRVNLDLGDARLAPDERRVDAVIRVLRELRPKILLAPLTSDMHPDHAVTGQLAKQARYLGGIRKLVPELAPHRPQLLLHYMAHETVPPTFIVDISTTFEAKMESIRCYASQLHDPQRSEPETMISAPTFLENLEIRARHHGSLIGASYGEAYFQDSPPRIVELDALIAPT